MADKSIHELPVASLLTDAGLLVVYQDEKTQSIRGELIKQYAAQGVSQYVEEAKTAAQTAGDAAGEAQAAAEEAKGVALYPPQVNPETGMWQTWDAAQQQYVDTDQKAEGPEGPAGSSIQSIERTSGTGAPGTTDTYTVTLTNGSTTTFQVYNGADGAGTGDFKADGSVPMTGALQMAGHTISGLPAPVADSDPVRKQDVPTLAADRQLSNLDTPQAALANLGACTNPNKLINGDFLINQKNWSRTESAITQKIHDMWELSWTPGVSGSAEALQDGGVKVDSTTVSGFDPGGVITNKFEGAINGTWTLSVYMKVDSLPAGSNIAIQVANDTKQSYPGYSITSETAKIGAYFIYTLTTDISGWEDSDTMRVSVYNYGGPAVFSVKAVKLEPGKSQTRAYLKSDGTWELLQQPESEYVTQLLKCQYYRVNFGKSSTWESVGFGEATSETSIMVVVPIPVALRIKPTAMLTGTLNLRSGNQVLECNSLFVDVFGPSTVLINASVTGATPGAAYDVFVPPGSFLTLDCSL